jgi:hypothetical protein
MPQLIIKKLASLPFSFLSYPAMLSGEFPPSYLIYTTGQGFPPTIEGVPEAMRGIATVFMLALLTGKQVQPMGLVLPRAHIIQGREHATNTNIDF